MEDDQTLSPADAMQRLVDLLASDRAYEASPPTYWSIIDPFLTNPARDRDAILLLAQVVSTVLVVGNTHRFTRPAARLRFRSAQRHQLGLAKRIQPQLARIDEEIGIDFPWVRSAATPAEWVERGIRVHLLELRVSIPAAFNRLPSHVKVELAIAPAGDESAQDELRFVGSFPTTGFSQVGDYEIEVAADGKIVQRSAAEGRASADLSHLPIKASFGASGRQSSESTEASGERVRLTYTAKVLRIVGSAVSRNAWWEQFQTEDHIPVGELDFLATFAGPLDLKSVSAHARVLATYGTKTAAFRLRAEATHLLQLQGCGERRTPDAGAQPPRKDQQQDA